MFCFFSQACSLLRRPHIHLNAVDKADILLLKFCQDLYGEEECTPSMHMHCHIRDCITRCWSTWCFSFEIYNGILENMLQNLKKFCSLQNLSSVNLPTVIPTELQHTFMQMKHERIAVPDTTTDTSASFRYVENLLCLPNVTGSGKTLRPVQKSDMSTFSWQCQNLAK